MPLICTPIRARTQAEALKKWKALKRKTDLVELWLDDIKDLDLPSLLRQKPLPVICRGKRALEAARYGADYVDIRLIECHSEALQCHPEASFGHSEEQSDEESPQSLDSFKKDYLGDSSLSFRMTSGAKLILSYHNFKKTPSRDSLLKKAQAMKKRGADIVKIATHARTLDDCLNMILLAQELRHLKIPHILIAMGKRGRLSRILTPHVGGTIMFAPLKANEATASGQLTVKELRDAWKLIKIEP